jgi:hypothetical protein
LGCDAGGKTSRRMMQQAGNGQPSSRFARDFPRLPMC